MRGRCASGCERGARRATKVPAKESRCGNVLVRWPCQLRSDPSSYSSLRHSSSSVCLSGTLFPVLSDFWLLVAYGPVILIRTGSHVATAPSRHSPHLSPMEPDGRTDGRGPVQAASGTVPHLLPPNNIPGLLFRTRTPTEETNRVTDTVAVSAGRYTTRRGTAAAAWIVHSTILWTYARQRVWCACASYVTCSGTVLIFLRIAFSRGEHGKTSATAPADMSDDVADGLQLCLFVGSSMPGPTLYRSFVPASRAASLSARITI